MTKNSIYSHLDSTFWTGRKCHSCQTYFTSSDYQTQNYQLIFTQLLKVDRHSLTATFQLFHKSCCSNCTSYLQDLNATKITSTKRNY